MNCSLLLSSPSSPPPPKKPLYDRDTYNPAILTYKRFAKMYANEYDLYCVHFHTIGKAIVDITIIGPNMPFIYSRRFRGLPNWTGLAPKFNDNKLFENVKDNAVFVFINTERLQLFRDLFCTRLPAHVRYCLYPPEEMKKASIDDTVINMAKYYKSHSNLYIHL